MQRFEIFRKGKHTSAGGTTLTFSEDDVRRAVEAYDPAVHEAPIVVGHPRDDAPAYGWVKGLEFSADGSMHAQPDQLDADFAEMVQAGRFKKRSASFYTPDSPANPKPGTYYLRHVGFLGAQPPAVKGLKEVAFNEEDGAIEFMEAYTTAGLFRRLRDWMLGRYGQDEANEVLPSHLVEDLEDQARRELEGTAEEADPSNFTETPQENPMNTNKNGAPANPKTETTGGQGPTDFSERETKLKAREERIAKQEAQLQRQAAVAEFQEHAEAGRIRPQDVEALADFAATLESEEAVNFGEGDGATEATPRKFLSDFIAALPKAIDYSERAADAEDDDAGDIDPRDVADRAAAYAEDYKRRTGSAMTFTRAVEDVRAGKDKQ